MAWSASIDRLIYVKCTCKSAKVDSTAARQPGAGRGGLGWAGQTGKKYIHSYLLSPPRYTLHSFTQALFKHTLNIQLPIPSPRRGDEARDTILSIRPAANKIIFQSLFLRPAAARTHHPHHQSSAGCCWAPILSHPIIQTTTRNIMSFIHAFILKCSLHIINTTQRFVVYSLWPWILTRRNPCHQQFIERNSSWECSHRKYWIKIPFVTVKYLNICNNKSIWAGYQGSAARWGAGTRWTVRTGARNTISIIYCPWSAWDVQGVRSAFREGGLDNIRT